MNRRLPILVVAGAMLCGVVFGAPARADGLQFEEGLAAFEQGNYALAAQKWYEAANEGIPQAQYNLGTLYYAGRGVTQDRARAAQWFQLAGQGGVAEAQFNLGAMYANGDGVPRDLVAAFVTCPHV